MMGMQMSRSFALNEFLEQSIYTEDLPTLHEPRIGANELVLSGIKFLSSLGQSTLQRLCRVTLPNGVGVQFMPKRRFQLLKNGLLQQEYEITVNRDLDDRTRKLVLASATVLLTLCGLRACGAKAQNPVQQDLIDNPVRTFEDFSQHVGDFIDGGVGLVGTVLSITVSTTIHLCGMVVDILGLIIKTVIVVVNTVISLAQCAIKIVQAGKVSAAVFVIVSMTLLALVAEALSQRALYEFVFMDPAFGAFEIDGRVIPYGPNLYSVDIVGDGAMIEDSVVNLQEGCQVFAPLNRTVDALCEITEWWKANFGIKNVALIADRYGCDWNLMRIFDDVSYEIAGVPTSIPFNPIICVLNYNAIILQHCAYAIRHGPAWGETREVLSFTDMCSKRVLGGKFIDVMNKRLKHRALIKAMGDMRVTPFGNVRRF